jgi:hypothetical protein
MGIKHIICGGIGFSPGSVKYIPTRGFISGDTPAPPVVVIPIYEPNTRTRPGYASFQFPPQRFPPAYVKTR